MFQVGDYVRRKPEWQNQLFWEDFVKPELRNLTLLVIWVRASGKFKFFVPKEFKHLVSDKEVFDQRYFEKVVVTKNMKDYA